jgi:hypothetical protein
VSAEGEAAEVAALDAEPDAALWAEATLVNALKKAAATHVAMQFATRLGTRRLEHDAIAGNVILSC